MTRMIMATRSVMPPWRRAECCAWVMFVSSARQHRLAWADAVEQRYHRGVDVALVVVPGSRHGAGEAEVVGLVVRVLDRLLEVAGDEVHLHRHHVREVGRGARRP